MQRLRELEGHHPVLMILDDLDPGEFAVLSVLIPWFSSGRRGLFRWEVSWEMRRSTEFRSFSFARRKPIPYINSWLPMLPTLGTRMT